MRSSAVLCTIWASDPSTLRGCAGLPALDASGVEAKLDVDPLDEHGNVELGFWAGAVEAEDGLQRGF